MISIRNLTVRYGTFTAVDGLSLEIPRGQLFGLVGPNGAGKTTTLKVVCGLLVPSEGSVSVDGHDVVLERSTVQRSIGYMADFFGVYDYLTTTEYLSFFGGIYGVEGLKLQENIDQLLKLTNLEIKRHANIRELSRGMKQRLYFARALIHDPDLLVLDEPASGMDPRGRAELAEALREIHRRGKTIIISSHILAELQELCTSVGILEKGKFVATRSLSEAAETDANRHVFLLVCRDDLDRALAAVRAHPDVRSAERVESKIVISIRDTDEAVSRLIHDLAQRDIRLQLPRYDGMNLEEVFLKMTKGELT